MRSSWLGSYESILSASSPSCVPRPQRANLRNRLRKPDDYAHSIPAKSILRLARSDRASDCIEGMLQSVAQLTQFYMAVVHFPNALRAFRDKIFAIECMRNRPGKLRRLKNRSGQRSPTGRSSEHHAARRLNGHMWTCLYFDVAAPQRHCHRGVRMESPEVACR